MHFFWVHACCFFSQKLRLNSDDNNNRVPRVLTVVLIFLPGLALGWLCVPSPGSVCIDSLTPPFFINNAIIDTIHSCSLPGKCTYNLKSLVSIYNLLYLCVHVCVALEIDARSLPWPRSTFYLSRQFLFLIFTYGSMLPDTNFSG